MSTPTVATAAEELLAEFRAIHSDDVLLDALATARMSDDTEETFRLLAAWREQIHSAPDLQTCSHH